MPEIQPISLTSNILLAVLMPRTSFPIASSRQAHAPDQRYLAKEMKSLISKLTNVNPVWWCIKSTFGFSSFVYLRLRAAKGYNTKAEKHARIERKFDELVPQLVVRHGPFKGMRYPSKESVGSAFYPKLLGSYEQEFSHAISYIIRQSYTAVVDVGCAEGYYAVGLGMHFKNAGIFAFDQDKHALALCRKMAELNDVDVQTGGFCDKARLLELELGDRALIFCDCEGYELELTNTEIVEKLEMHDFLIETHDFLKIDTTNRLLSILSQTHECEVFKSVDDILKAYTYDFDELNHFDLDERQQVLAEDRPTIMRWIFARSRNGYDPQASLGQPATRLRAARSI